MEAQQIITMSINKITGSRGQRGGVSLRKNLLVATVLHSARALYYEEMCNRMARNSVELGSREMEVEEDDCTGSPDWGDQEKGVSTFTEENTQQQQSITNTTTRPEDKENYHPSTPDAAQSRLEKPDASSTGVAPSTTTTTALGTTPVESKLDSTDKDRSVLGQKNTNSTPSEPPSSQCSACKRKRSDSSEETREAYESVVPKKSKTESDDLLVTSSKQNSEQITSLVTIFKSGFHGLSGEAKSSSNSNISSLSGEAKSSGASNHLQPSSQSSSYTSSMPRPFEQLQMPIAAC